MPRIAESGQKIRTEKARINCTDCKWERAIGCTHPKESTVGFYKKPYGECWEKMKYGKKAK